MKALFFCGERLPGGKGFVLHIEPLRGELNGDKENDARVINENTELLDTPFSGTIFVYVQPLQTSRGAPLPPA